MSRWAVVVPTCRPERFRKWHDDWRPLLVRHSVELHTVYDEPPWEGIPRFIPRRSDMIRSWGFYRAWANGAEFTLSMDDDVSPVVDIFERYEEEFEKTWPLSPYLSVGALTNSGLEMRGFPYEGRRHRAAVQFGGWTGMPDLDAVTQLNVGTVYRAFTGTVLPVPRGTPVTCCAMNFAFRTEHAPIMWQLPLHAGRYNRFGDIWAGLLMKKTFDHIGEVMLVNGRAQVAHERASDPFVNLEKEAPGLAHNERLWGELEEGDYRQVTDSFARYFAKHDLDYTKHFLECRDEWLSLFG